LQSGKNVRIGAIPKVTNFINFEFDCFILFDYQIDGPSVSYSERGPRSASGLFKSAQDFSHLFLLVNKVYAVDCGTPMTLLLN
jgi:hypothetical protein